MRMVPRLLAALTITGLLLPLGVSPVLADPDVDTTYADPTSGPVGTEVHLDGRAGDTDEEPWVYFEIADDEWVLVLDDDRHNWDFLPYEDDDDDILWYDYFTDEPFEIPECVGGDHLIAVVDEDVGDEADDDEIEGASPEYDDFEVEPKLEFISVDGEDCDPDEAEGSMGTVVEVEGTGFGDMDDEDSDFVIWFGDGIDAIEVELDEVDSESDNGTWRGTFTVPATAQGEHEVRASGDIADEEDCIPATFTMQPGIKLEPSSGIVGSTFTVQGSGFHENEDDVVILFDGEEAKSGFQAGSDGTFEVDVTVPEAAMGVHDIDAEGDDTNASDVADKEFEVEPDLQIDPESGNVDTQIEATGTGLPADTSVTVAYDDDTKGTGTTNSDGTLAGITFAATHTQSTHTTDHTVAATFDDDTDDSTTLNVTFTMESTPPPKPTPSTPENGTRVGLVGSQTPTLTWDVVEDPSGVTYSLEISTMPDFSQVVISKSGLVAEGSSLIVSPSGPEMSYTLTEAEALPYGTYYWRVKAVDGALNDSGWSASNNFKAGLMPTWAFIVVIVLAAVLVGALIYVLIIRDRVGLYD
ncbi:MAG: IPT/TIG domain-containing protein [Chloroflexota bacterium]